MKTTLCMLVIFALYGLALATASSDVDADESKLKNQANKPDVPKGSNAGNDDGQNGFGSFLRIPGDMMQAGAQVARKMEDTFIGGPGSNKNNPTKASKDN